MKQVSRYGSPMGDLFLVADETGLIQLGFEEQNPCFQNMEFEMEEKSLVLEKAKQWLDVYFSGREPDFMPPLSRQGTRFQQEVWKILCDIPYGETRTYGEIAGQVAKIRGKRKMSAQAIGGAVGKNPILLMVPCHRVVGAGGSLVGYAGGVDRKERLLALEQKGIRS